MKTLYIATLILALIVFPIAANALKLYDSSTSSKDTRSTSHSIEATKQISTHGYQNQYGIPVGMIVAWGAKKSIATSDEFKWLECNGAKFDKEKYPELYAVLGSDTLPNLNNQFLRGTTRTDILFKTASDSLASYNAQVANPEVTGNLEKSAVSTTLKKTTLSAGLSNRAVTTKANTSEDVEFGVSGTAAGQNIEGEFTGTITALGENATTQYGAKIDSSEDSFTAVDFIQGSKVSQEDVVCGETEKTYDCEPCESEDVFKGTETYYFCKKCYYYCGNTVVGKEVREVESNVKNYSGPGCYKKTYSDYCGGSVSRIESEGCESEPRTKKIYETVTTCAQCTMMVPVYCKKNVTGITDVTKRQITGTAYQASKKDTIAIQNGTFSGTAQSSDVTGTTNGTITIPTITGTVTKSGSLGSLNSGVATGKVDNSAITGSLVSKDVKYTGSEHPYTGFDETAPMHTFVRYFIRAIP